MIIGLELFKELVEKQRLLDAAIIKEKEITEPVHPDHTELMYRLEIAETINEMKGDIKWWSDKPSRHPEFLEEYVDALHFLLSWTYQQADQLAEGFSYNEGEDRIDYMYRMLKADYQKCDRCLEIKRPNVTDWKVAFRSITAPDMFVSFGYLTLIAERYGIGELSVRTAYYDKNEVNFKRLAEGY